MSDTICHELYEIVFGGEVKVVDYQQVCKFKITYSLYISAFQSDFSLPIYKLTLNEFFLVFILREERQHEQGRGRERGRHRI